jgi:hypothetical protein
MITCVCENYKECESHVTIAIGVVTYFVLPRTTCSGSDSSLLVKSQVKISTKRSNQITYVLNMVYGV